MSACDSAIVPLPSGGHALVLLAADGDLGAQLSPHELSLALRTIVVPFVRVPRGAWTLPVPAGGASQLTGLLLVEGLLARHVGLGGRVCTQLVDTGELFNPIGDADTLLPSHTDWEALAPSVVAVLDRRFAAVARRWPQVGANLQRRLAERANRLALQGAIAQLPTVEQRILAMFWLLAERHGRVCPDGVLLRLRLTHRLIGQLVGAQRPSVTLALGVLTGRGWVERADERSWLLPWGSRAVLESAPPAERRPRLVALSGGREANSAS
jgi:CRP-like cAMP-binding protein